MVNIKNPPRIKGYTYSFTELAGNTSLFTGRISPQRMFSPESGRNGTLLEGIVDGVRSTEVLLEQHVHSPGHLGHEEELAQSVEGALPIPVPFDPLAGSEVGRGRTVRGGIAALLELLSGSSGGDEARGSDSDGLGGGCAEERGRWTGEGRHCVDCLAWRALNGKSVEGELVRGGKQRDEVEAGFDSGSAGLHCWDCDWFNWIT